MRKSASYRSAGPILTINNFKPNLKYYYFYFFRRRSARMSKPFVTLFSLKNVTQSMKMNVKLFTRRDAPLNMNLNAQQVLLTIGGFIPFF